MIISQISIMKRTALVILVVIMVGVVKLGIAYSMTISKSLFAGKIIVL